MGFANGGIVRLLDSEADRSDVPVEAAEAVLVAVQGPSVWLGSVRALRGVAAAGPGRGCCAGGARGARGAARRLPGLPGGAGHWGAAGLAPGRGRGRAADGARARDGAARVVGDGDGVGPGPGAGRRGVEGRGRPPRRRGGGDGEMQTAEVLFAQREGGAPGAARARAGGGALREGVEAERPRDLAPPRGPEHAADAPLRAGPQLGEPLVAQQSAARGSRCGHQLEALHYDVLHVRWQLRGHLERVVRTCKASAFAQWPLICGGEGWDGGESESDPLCDSPSGCCFFTGPWTVTRSPLRMLRRVAAFCRPLRPVLLLVSLPRSRRPVVGVLGLIPNKIRNPSQTLVACL